MKSSVFVFDPTASDKQSKVRGIGRYLQILKENFPHWTFTNNLTPLRQGFEGQAIEQSNPSTTLRVNNQTIFINPFFNLLQPPLITRRIAQKQIAVIHDLIPLKYPEHFPIGIKGKINVFLNKLSLNNYDRIITDSEASKKDIIKILRINEEKIKVVYPCLPKSFLKLKIENSKLIENYCLYVGDATWNKNLVNFAKAIKILNVSCVFVGKVFEDATGGTGRGGWQKELMEFLEEIKDDKHFILKGFVSDEELIQLYQQARVNILPSHDEGFGFSFLEAASQKCPTVLADIPVLREISAGNALFANPENPHDLANTIGELYWNSDKRNLMGTKTFERSNYFSPSQLKKSFLDILKNL